jgi:hypothetical protein
VTAPKKRGPGRPRAANPRRYQAAAQVSEQELDELRERAERDGARSLSDWIRIRIGLPAIRPELS